jgi:hypothetical protein
MRTLEQAIDGFCTTLKSSNTLNSIASRAENFTKGGSTGGEVPTPLVAIGDQFVLHWCRRNGVCTPTQNSDFYTPKYWRTWLLRLLRDKLDGLFTAYCSVSDPEGDAKRRQKDIDADEFVEILVQGLYPTDAIKSIFSQALTPNDAVSKIRSFGGGTGSSPLEMSSISLSLDRLSRENQVEVDDYEEEAALDNLQAPTVSNSASEDPSSSSSAVESPAAPSIPRSIDSFISWLLVLKRSLPERGPPSTVLSNESMVSQLADNVRCVIVTTLLQSVSRELRLMVNSAAHMLYQLSGGSIPHEALTEEDVFSLLAIERNEEGLKWLVSQLIIGTKFRTNSRFRSELEKVNGAQSSEEDPSTSIFLLPVEELCSRLNATITGKQVQRWTEEEAIRVDAMKERFQRAFLSHPRNVGFPLRIFCEDHLENINRWTQLHRNFTVTRTKCPLDMSYTTMANNTYLMTGCRFFMRPRSPYEVISIIFGSREERQQNGFFEHMHTTSRRFYDDVKSLPESEQFQNFLHKFQARYMQLLL